MPATVAANAETNVEFAGKVAGPCVFVLFGASGDLTKRKLIPALFNLVKASLLPRDFVILGVAFDQLSEEAFRTQVSSFLPAEDRGTEAWKWFQERLRYQVGSFGDAAMYAGLGTRLKELDQTFHTQGNYLFYLATAPKFFAPIVEQLGVAGLSRQEKGQWRRIIIEKPFGTDLDSAKTLNRQIKAVLSENQIYRIDHYLGKETVQNIMV